MELPKWISYPIILLFIGLVLPPIMFLVLGAFWEDGSVTFNYYENFFSTLEQWHLLKNSLILATGTAIFSCFLGFPLAFLCQRTNLWGRRFWSIVYLIPLLIPPYMQALIWDGLLNESSTINAFLTRFLGLKPPAIEIHNLPGAIFVMTLAYFPFVTLLSLNGLKGIDRQQEEAGLVYQGLFRTLRKVTFPLVFPHVASGGLFVFVFAFTNFGVPDILRIKVFPVEIFIQFSAFYDEKAATVLTVPIILITMAALFFQYRLMRGKAYINLTKGFQESICYDMGPMGKVLATSFCLVLMILSLGVPTGYLIKSAGPAATYGQVISLCYGEIMYSVVVALIAAAIMVFVGFFVALFLERSSSPMRTPLDYVVQIPFAVPPIVLGIGLIGVWNHPLTTWIYGSSMIIVIGYFAHFVPFAIRSIGSGIKQIHPHLEEMGFISVKGPLRVIRKIVIPLAGPEMVAAFFITFVLCMGELGTTLLVIPPGRGVIPVTIHNYMHYGAEHMTAALCLVLLGIMLLFSVLVFQLHRMSRFQGRQRLR